MVSYLLTSKSKHSTRVSLNPYCSGQWSRTVKTYSSIIVILVLILIVVDNGLVPISSLSWTICSSSLNPYCIGQWSRTVRRANYEFIYDKS